MIESSKSKKNIFYMIVLVLTLIVMIIGATMAYFSMVANQTNEGTVLYTGKLEINYIDGTFIQNPELIPMKEPTYSTYKSVYRNTFSVRSSGTLDQTMSIDMVITNNEFSTDTIKYVIFNSQGTKILSGNIPQNGTVNLANNIYLAHNGTAQYTLIIWLDNTNNNQNNEMGNKISGKINVYAQQIKY